MNDWELIQDFVSNDSQAAFCELVSRYTPMVFSSAARRVGSGAAEDVTQVVFMILAQKAKRLGRRRCSSLAGWLFRTTRFASMAHLREQTRRQEREQKAHDADEFDRQIHGVDEMAWLEIRPFLDSALDKLSSRDREAIVLRYLLGASYREVGDQLGVSENSATKCVERAVDKMRAALSRLGATVPLATLTAILAARTTEAAVEGLSISALASVAAGSAGAAASVAATVAATTKAIIACQIKAAAIATCSVGAGVALSVGAAVYGVQAAAEASLPFELVDVRPLTLCYIGRATLPDGSEAYQVNSRGDRRTYIVRPGDVVEGFTVATHTNANERRARTGVAPSSITDSSVLMLRSAERVLALEKRLPADAGTYLATIRGKRESRVAEVAQGEVFDWGSGRYEVVGVGHARQRLRVRRLTDGRQVWLPVKK